MKVAVRSPFRILCGCLRGAFGETLESSDLPTSEAEWEKVLRVSSSHMSTLLLRWALREQGCFAGLPSGIAEYLDALYTLNLERNRRYEDQLAQFIQLLNHMGVRPVLLKGSAAIASRLYPTSGERMMFDMDVLVPAERLHEIVDALAGIGYQAIHNDEDEDLSSHHHYRPLFSPDWPAPIELHVQPVSLLYTKLLSCDEVYRDSVPLRWRDGDCLLPSPTVFILHNIIHAFLVDVKSNRSYLNLKQLFEFVHAVGRYGENIDWRMIKNRFDHFGYGEDLRSYLAFGNVCLDFQPPQDVKIGQRDRDRIQFHLILLGLSNPAVKWTINFYRQIRRRIGNLLEAPQKTKKLLSGGFYSRMYRDIFSRR